METNSPKLGSVQTRSDLPKIEIEQSIEKPVIKRETIPEIDREIDEEIDKKFGHLNENTPLGGHIS